MGFPSTVIIYQSDSGSNYLLKQQNRLMALAGNTKATSATQFSGLPNNIRPRKAVYENAGKTITLVFGQQSDYASAPASITEDDIAYSLSGKTAERVRLYRP